VIKESSTCESTLAYHTRWENGLHYGIEKRVLSEEEGLKAVAQGLLNEIDYHLKRLEDELIRNGGDDLGVLHDEAKYLARQLYMVQRDRELTEADALRGSSKARMLLRGVLQQEYRASEEVRQNKNDIDVCIQTNDSKLQQSYSSPHYTETVLQSATALGRVQSHLSLTSKYKDEMVESIGGKHYIPTLKGEQLETLMNFEQWIAWYGHECQRLEEEIQAEAEAYEQWLHSADVELIMQDINSTAWDNPTPLQLEQEAQEDEKGARHEASTLQDFLLPDVKASLREDYLGTGGKTIKSCPILIVIGRDCPAATKQKVVSFIHETFPGMFVHFGYEDLRAKEINMWKYQETFGDGKHAIIEADQGSTLASRRAFLAATFALKHGVDPQPRCILITGTSHDKRGLVCIRQSVNGCKHCN